MPIRINLLAEAQAAEELRRKDPVKRAYFAAGFLVLLVGLWASTLQFKIMTAKGEMGTLDTKWRDIEKNYKAAVESQRAIRESEDKLAALQNLNTNRFLWGNALNALQYTLNGVDAVQVTHLRTDQSYMITEGTPPRTNDNQVIPGKPGTATERIKLTIDGTDSAAGSRIEKFKGSILGVPYFKAHLKKTDGVILTQRSAPTQSKTGGVALVTFSLECYVPDKTR